MAVYCRERPQATESGAVVGPAQSLRLGTNKLNFNNAVSIMLTLNLVTSL